MEFKLRRMVRVRGHLLTPTVTLTMVVLVQQTLHPSCSLVLQLKSPLQHGFDSINLFYNKRIFLNGIL